MIAEYLCFSQREEHVFNVKVTSITVDERSRSILWMDITGDYQQGE